MPAIKSISCRRVLNSHVEFTSEFIVELSNGSVGFGASPRGETIGLYEENGASMCLQSLMAELGHGGWANRTFDQETFDAWLEERTRAFGRNNTFALSLALFNASRKSYLSWKPAERSGRALAAPFLCLNVLNGGWHAYTNPVLSDFPEYLLVAKSRRIPEVVDWHNEIQRRVREKLNRLPFEVVSGNLVHCFRTADNRECIDLLLSVRDSSGLASELDPMIDASAGDLWANDGYRFSVTDHSSYSSQELAGYWLDLTHEYGLRFLEDPFHEKDTRSWQQLTALQQECQILGDNLYCSNADRIELGAKNRCTHGVVIKPNQAGTVTAVRRAIEAARDAGQMVMTSHRSISTEETFLSELTCHCGVSYLKIGPLCTDYSSVLRLNSILRQVEAAAYVEIDSHQHTPACQHGLQSTEAVCGDS